jgi:hypothetical protein
MTIKLTAFVADYSDRPAGTLPVQEVVAAVYDRHVGSAGHVYGADLALIDVDAPAGGGRWPLTLNGVHVGELRDDAANGLLIQASPEELAPYYD